MFYIAAERGAQQFIEIIFSSSAGQVVFKSYKDRTPLPEDVARANGHEDLAQYLQDVNTRYMDSLLCCEREPVTNKMNKPQTKNNSLCGLGFPLEVWSNVFMYSVANQLLAFQKLLWSTQSHSNTLCCANVPLHGCQYYGL